MQERLQALAEPLLGLPGKDMCLSLYFWATARKSPSCILISFPPHPHVPSFFFS
jgi:hypothetical protein